MIGIFGGTFDPVHFGHLRVALDIQETLRLDGIRWLPLNQAVHRSQPLASGQDRLAMLELAIEALSGWTVDARELERDMPSWTLDSLQSLRQELPHETLCLMLGVDAFLGFLNWREPMRILELAHLIVMTRPGFSLAPDERLAELLKARRATMIAQLRQQNAGLIWLEQVTQLGISSTDIRTRIKTGRSVRYLLPESVAKWIETRGLYAS